MAMEITLRVTPEKLNQTSQQFNQSLSSVQNITRAMLAIATVLRGSWAGEAATVFYGKLNGLNNDMNVLHRMIKEHVRDLQEACNEFKRAEQQNVQTNQTLQNNQIR